VNSEEILLSYVVGQATNYNIVRCSGTIKLRLCRSLMRLVILLSKVVEQLIHFLRWSCNQMHMGKN